MADWVPPALWAPTGLGWAPSPEGVGQWALTGVRVALGNERHRHTQPGPFQHQILCRETCVPSVHTEGEGQILTVAPNLVAQKLAWNGKKSLRSGDREQRGKGVKKRAFLQ